MLRRLHHRLRFSLKYRIAAIIFVLEAVMMGAVLGVTLRISQNETAKQLETNQLVMHQLLSNLSRVALLTAEYDELQPYIEEVVRNPHVSLVLLADRRGRVVVSNEHARIGDPLPEFENTDSLRWLTQEIHNSSGKVGVLAIRFSHAQLLETGRRVRNLGVFIALVGMTLIAIVGILIGHLLTRRLEVLTATAERLAGGDVEARTGLTGHDEVAIVGRAFDGMAQSIGENVEALRHATDLLEQRVAERTRQLAEARDEAVAANHSKSAFLANMSHEIRTPLTAIIGFSESLLDSRQQIAERIDAIRTIIRSSNHLLRIINDILDVSKIEANKLEIEQIDVSPFDILDDVRAIVALLAEDKGLHFEIEYDFPLPARIVSDPLRLKQILINLCNNAIKFTLRGRVSVQVSCNTRDATLSFRVRDTGIGMHAGQIDHLFQAFSQADASTTREFGGTGLGLYLSRQLTERLHGSLTVDSVPGRGSCFTLTIPTGALDPDSLVTERPPPSARILTPTSGEVWVNGSVLLAEDNPDNQQLISLLLRRAGANVVVAENGRAAVELTGEQTFDLIIMDIQMPVMSGLEAVQALRARGYAGTIVALTANATREDIDTCLAAGFDDFMSKPVDMHKLHETLARHLHAGRQPSGPRTPITSSLIAMDPTLRDLVAEFVSRLPAVAAEIGRSYRHSDFAALKFQIHSLKGSAGSFGYHDLFKLCQIIEFEMAKSNEHGVGNLLEELDALIRLIEQGAPILQPTAARGTAGG